MPSPSSHRGMPAPAVLIGLACIVVPLSTSADAGLFFAAKTFVLWLLTALAGLCLMAGQKAVKPKVSLPSAGWVIAAYAGWVLVSSAATGGSFYAAERMFSICLYALVFFVSVQALQPSGSRRLVLYLALLGLSFVSIYGLAQAFGWVEVDWESRPWGSAFGRRVFSTMGNPNWLASYLIVVIPAALAEVLRSQGKRMIFPVAAFALGMAALLASGSLAAMAGCVVGCVFVAVRAAKSLTDDGRRRLWMCAWVAAGLAIIFIAVKGPSAAGSDVPLKARALHREAARQMALDHPLVGVGPGRFLVFSPLYEGRLMMKERFAPLISTPIAARRTEHAHQEWINAAAETGWPGLVLLILLQAAVMLVYRRSLKIASSDERVIFHGLAGGLIAVWVESFFGFPFHLVAAMTLVMVFVGCLTAASLPGEEYRPRRLIMIFIIIIILGLWASVSFVAALNRADSMKLRASEGFAEALDKIRFARRISPSDPRLSFDQAVTLRLAGRPQEALDALQLSLKEEPYLVQNYMNIALNALALGDRAQAEAAYRRIMTIKPADPEAARALMSLQQDSQ